MDRSLILKEAIRIEIELSQLKEPNSPSKTHYMVKLSDDFIKAAGSVDTNSLLNSIKVKDISLSTLKDEKGIFAFTSKKHEFPIYEIEGSSNTTVNVLRQGRECALLQRNIPKENNPLNIKDPTPYIVAWNFNAKDGKCNWGQGHYCGSLDSGCSLYSEKETSSIGNKSIKERVVEAQEKANSQHNREIGKSKIDRTKENSI